MKKIVLTAAVILGFTTGSYAQDFYIYQDDNGIFFCLKQYDNGVFFNQNQYNQNQDGSRGLFGLGPIYEGMSRDGGSFSLCLPGHNFTTNWNGGSQGHDDELIVPLGNGALLLVGFGAAYALSKRKKKD